MCVVVVVFHRPKDLKFSKGLMIPKRGLIYDHVYIRRQYGSWHQWTSLLTPVDIDEKTKVRELIRVKGSNSVTGCLNVVLVISVALVCVVAVKVVPVFSKVYVN